MFHSDEELNLIFNFLSNLLKLLHDLKFHIRSFRVVELSTSCSQRLLSSETHIKLQCLPKMFQLDRSELYALP